MQRHDYLLRMLEEISQAIGRAFHLKAENNAEESREEIHAAYSKLGLDHTLVDMLDHGSVIRMLDDHKRPAALELFVGDAELALLERDHEHARKRIDLADRLFADTSADLLPTTTQTRLLERLAAARRKISQS